MLLLQAMSADGISLTGRQRIHSSNCSSYSSLLPASSTPSSTPSRETASFNSFLLLLSQHHIRYSIKSLLSVSIHSIIIYSSPLNAWPTYRMYGRIHFLLRVSFPSVRLREYWSIVQLVSLQKWMLLYLLLDQNIRRRWSLCKPFTMAVISKVYDHPHTHLHELLKRRHNWASRNPGVILVFCIVFAVVMGLCMLFLYRRMLRRKAEKQAFTG